MRMDIGSMQKALLISFAWIMILAFSLGSATYAWFTGNQRVYTSYASGRTGEDGLELLLGTSEGDLSRNDEAEISRVNSSEDDMLLPVSTSDLQSWAHAVSISEDSDDGYGVYEEVDIDESGTYCYHGQIYMEVRTDRSERFEGMKAAIYLDEGSGTDSIGTDESSSGILAASRLGFVFSEDSSSAVILYFDDAQETSDRRRNTYIGSTLASEEQVLEVNGSSVSAVDDPAVAISTVTMTSDSTEYPESSLAVIELNTPVLVDIYFYLEGCDPDCVESIIASEVTMKLGFYAALTQE